MALVPTARLTTTNTPLLSTTSLASVDLRNMALLMFGFVCLLVLVPPLRSFPITDDWTYARSVPRLLSLSYVPDEAAQASALAHIAWGAVFAGLFGQSFTVLSIANLVMGLTGVIIFYLLLRQTGVVSNYALLGAGVLGLNPIYLYLSYTFMTDVTFLVYILLGCLFFVKAAQGYGEKWLWLGGVATAMAYLTRQYGILLVPAALIYLWWSREWLWRKALAITAIPVLAVVSYTLFERAQPKTLSSRLVSDVMAYIVQHPLDFAIARLQHDAWLLYALGLFLIPVVKLPHRPLLALPIFGLLILAIILTVRQYGSAFPQTGNIIDHSGPVMFDYFVTPIWSEVIWTILAVIGSFSISLYLSWLGELAWAWVRAGSLKKRDTDPKVILYLLGIMLTAVVLVFTPYVFDRYALTLLPILLLPALYIKAKGEEKDNATRAALILLPLAAFAVLGQRDYMEHAAVRWRAAETLAAQGVTRDKIDAGFEWGEWYLFDEGLNYMRRTGDYTNAGYAAKAVLDPIYMVSDISVPQYDTVSKTSYSSWLNGGETRYVYVLKRR